MDAELLRLVVVNFPNYFGFFLLYVQQSKIISALLEIVKNRDDTEPGDRL